MIYTKEKLEEISYDLNGLIERYRKDFKQFKEGLSIPKDAVIVWSQGFDDPYNAGYINDLQKSPSRKIYKREPKNKAFVSKTYYENGAAIYTEDYDSKGTIGAETFYVYEQRRRISVCYFGAFLFSVSAELYDEKGRPTEYRSAILRKDIGSDERTDAGCMTYEYEDEHIIRAYHADMWNTFTPIITYDDPVYDGFEGIVLPHGIPPMNPQIVHSYDFTYGESGHPEEFTRTSYVCGKVSSRSFSTAKKLFSDFDSWGIGYFNSDK